jgi:hypothetical protein
MAAKRKQRKRQRIDTMIDFHVYEAQKARTIAAMIRKLTKAERLVNEQMLAMLEWATEQKPGRWNDIGPMPESKEAARLLAERGVIEIQQPQNQYRIKRAPK